MNNVSETDKFTKGEIIYISTILITIIFGFYVLYFAVSYLNGTENNYDKFQYEEYNYILDLPVQKSALTSYTETTLNNAVPVNYVTQSGSWKQAVVGIAKNGSTVLISDRLLVKRDVQQNDAEYVEYKYVENELIYKDVISIKPFKMNDENVVEKGFYDVIVHLHKE